MRGAIALGLGQTRQRTGGAIALELVVVMVGPKEWGLRAHGVLGNRVASIDSQSRINRRASDGAFRTKVW